MAVHELPLHRGDALRAIVHPTAPFRAQLVVFGPALSGSADDGDMATYDAAYQSVLGRPMRDQADLTETIVGDSHPDSLAGQLPGTPLASSAAERNGCDDGQDQWLVFVAPADATYSLGVTRAPSVAEEEGDEGAYTVTFETHASSSTQATGFDNSGSLDTWFAAAVQAQVPFLTDKTFFDPERFTYASDGPYAWDSCGESTRTRYGPDAPVS